MYKERGEKASRARPTTGAAKKWVKKGGSRGPRLAEPQGKAGREAQRIYLSSSKAALSFATSAPAKKEGGRGRDW